MDNVCNTFNPYLLWWFGVSDSQTDFNTPASQSYDVIGTTNAVLGTHYNIRAFWNAVPRSLWRDVPESEEYRWLLRTCQKFVSREELYFATSPTKDPDCLAGKLEWIQAHAPAWMHRQYFITPRKHKLGHRRELLIDDVEEHCRLFRKRGGKAILMPRPWNCARGQCPRAYILSELQRLTTL
jgi:hypothetical protein